MTPPVTPVFDCMMCGHCCSGRGGILLTARDRERLAAHLGLGVDEMLERYAEDEGRLPGIVTGADGYCVFYAQGTGCTVHPARPDVCRAWPFFRGNLLDESAFAMAREDCKGIAEGAEHAEFVRQGLAYLRANGLLHAGDDAPNALKPIPGVDIREDGGGDG